MKKYLFLFLFIIISLNILAGEFSISGSNELEFIYRNAEDSLHQFLEDKFKFDLSYYNFRFGMKFNAKLPRYDKFEPATELTSAIISSEWEERYLEFEADEFYLRGGIFDASIGSGIMLNAYNDTEMDEDNRLEGCKTSANFDKISFVGIYGISQNEDVLDKNDVVSGLDIEVNPISTLKIGLSGLNERFYVNGDDSEFNKKDIFGSRLEFSHDIFDLKMEYAKSKKYDDIVADINGNALYGNLSAYFNKFTLTATYKKYENFDDRFNEVPNANYSEQTIAEYGDHSIPGFEEEGIQGILQFMPNYANELILNYAEGWSFDKEVRQSDLHTEFIHYFENNSLKLQYSQLERIADTETTYYWSKETKPAISYDFLIKEIPILLKTEFKTKFKDNYGEDSVEYEPTFQGEISFEDYSLSVAVSHLFHDFEKISNSAPKVGAELIAYIWDHSNVKLFVGSEKGGQVCRNGVCSYQAPFQGVRITISTRF